MISEKVGFLHAVLILMPSILGELGTVEENPKDIVFITSLAIYVCFLGLIFGKASQVLVNLLLKGGVVMKKVNYENHIVICGWNYQGPKVVESLLSCGIRGKKAIVILADMEKVPYDSDDVDFVHGCPWREGDLIRAGIPKADNAIILTDIIGEKTSNPDADALMITLAIECLNRNIHTCVQLLSSENRIHLENANADEIICLDQVGGKLLVASALNHGVSNIIKELLTFNQGSELYRYHRKISATYIGKTLGEVGKELLDKKMILVAVETKNDDYITKEFSNDWIHSTGKDRVMMINPQGDYKLRENDSLFIISETEPTEL
jgi:voltage-gated potassium channel